MPFCPTQTNKLRPSVLKCSNGFFQHSLVTSARITSPRTLTIGVEIRLRGALTLTCPWTVSICPNFLAHRLLTRSLLREKQPLLMDKTELYSALSKLGFGPPPNLCSARK